MNPTMLLCDNGSRRPAATLALRRVAAELSGRMGSRVHAVSLQHSAKIDRARLGGDPAVELPAFLDGQLSKGERAFLILPLFFGPSRAISSFIPQTVEQARARHGDFQLDIADVLCPLPGGEPTLVDVLRDNALAAHPGPDHVILVDHGSPIPQVTAVRQWLGERLGQALPGIGLSEAVMERREGKEYDFNGDLLEDELERLAATGKRDINLAMLFLNPGRHAGEGGDIAEIVDAVRERHEGPRVHISPLVGEHKGLLDILERRARAALSHYPRPSNTDKA
ncbi:MAG: sirohydrochlorin chelatase [Gammaproteobacteria bacterium]